MFDGFETRFVDVSDTTIFCRVGGSGPPVLLLHGYPQTGAMWNDVAVGLADHFTVVCTDLRGYGASGKPASDDSHLAYSKRAMAQDQVEAMRALGFDTFAAAAHDRGGRVLHRMLLDHPEVVTRAAVLDIVPTRTMFESVDMTFGLDWYHWFFLAQPYDLPERLIGADPAGYLQRKFAQWGRSGAVHHPDALAEYERAFSDPAMIHATCEDYRAAATIDLEHDRADEDARIASPLLALWGGRGRVGQRFDVVGAWREKSASSVEGTALDCGHYVAEEQPAATLAALRDFFAEPGSAKHAAEPFGSRNFARLAKHAVDRLRRTRDFG
jgi:haloacetate dehalogenase